MNDMAFRTELHKFPEKIRKYLLKGGEVTIRDHATVTYRLNELIFKTMEEKDFFSPYIFLSPNSYDALKRKRYGRTIDITNKNGIEFLYNLYAKNTGTMISELIVLRKEEGVYRLLGYSRMGKCIACINGKVIHAMKSFFEAYHISYTEEMERVIPKVFGYGITYIQ